MDADQKEAPKKTRLGLYMYTPMLGGAEVYFKDLLWNIDRDHYDIIVFHEPWQEFVDFLDFSHAPVTVSCPVKVKEIGGHFGAKELTDTTAPQQLGWTERHFIRLHALHKKISSSTLKAPGRFFYALLRYALMPVNFLRLYRAFRAHPIDVLQVVNGGYPGAQSAQVAAVAAKLAGCRWCVMSICNTPAPITFPAIVERLINRLVSRSFDQVAVPADFIGQRLLELGEFRHAQLKKIPYGVAEVEQYGVNNHPVNGLDDHPTPSIGMVASFLAHKGQRYFLEALARIHQQDQNLFRAILVGDGPTLESMRTMATELGLDELVEFTGYQPLKETLQIIAGLDIFVLSSEMEGMPYVILHAMSLGKPIIATRVGGIPDIIVDQKTGLIVPARDVDALSHALRYLLESPTKRQAMGAIARARYEEHFSLPRMIERHASLYQSR